MHVTVSTHDDTRRLVALAVDDEKPGLDMLKHRLQSNRYIGHIFDAVDASEALRIISAEHPLLAKRRKAGLPAVDVVFADINMPGLTGMEMARVFAALNPAPELVFVSGHGDEAVNAFDLGAVDYVLKPYEQPRIDKAIDRVRAKLRERFGAPQEDRAAPSDDEVIPVELAGTTKLIPRSQVRWVEAQGDYARLHTGDGSHLVRVPLATLAERWADAGFVRIHRSYLVQLGRISELRLTGSGYVVVVDGTELPVSRRHTRDLKDKLVRPAKQDWIR